MAQNENYRKSLSVCSFNCRSAKNCIPVLQQLCANCDILLLQEHWLLPFDLDLLNTVHCEFYSYGLSAIDLSSDILIGRPYGGTAILYRKSLAGCIKTVHSFDSRITGLEIDSAMGPLLLLNVYMPTNYGDEHSLELYIDCLSKLHALIVDSNAIHTVIAGDFNCSPGSRFFGEFTQFSIDHGLVTSDLNRLNNVYTYISDDGSKMSWVDHILSSRVIDRLIDDVAVANEVIVSDHKPLSFTLSMTFDAGASCAHGKSSVAADVRLPNWEKCDDTVLLNYANYLDQLLSAVNIPHHLLSDECIDADYTVINVFYSEVLSCVSKAVGACIPTHACRNSTSHQNVPGWNSFVREKHDAARDAYLIWHCDGKPKFGVAFESMKRTRAIFKLALRYCKNNIEMMRADACAESLLDNDTRRFWNNVYKISNNKASSHVTNIGGVFGSESVCNMWKEHFEGLYNSKANSKHRAAFEERMQNCKDEWSGCGINLADVVSAIKRQKRDKAAGPDGLHMESFMYAGHRLYVYLSILINIF